MRRDLKNHIGERFGRLVVVRYSHAQQSPSGAVRHYWHCQCDCGNSHNADGSSLRRRLTISCGCAIGLSNKRRAVHNMSHAPEYGIWAEMHQRCSNPKNIQYARYGGRGIRVCDGWRDFQEFISAVGPRKSQDHTIDRVDNDGNYEPGNVRWATRSEQTDNRSVTRRVFVSGQYVSLTRLAEISGINRECIRGRLRRGWSPSRAVGVSDDALLLLLEQQIRDRHHCR